MSLPSLDDDAVPPEAEACLVASLAAALAGEAAVWPFGEGGAGLDNWAWERTRFHGVCLALAECGTLHDWPESLRTRILEEARLQVLWEMSHGEVLADTLAALAVADVDVLVTKGTALAYTLFDNPALRRRGDTDLLVRPEQRGEARRLLAERGFQRVGGSPRQEDWAFDTGGGFVHLFDLHWDASSVAALAQFYTVEEAFARARDLPRIGPGARGVDPVLLFLSDSLNQALHHANGYLVEGERMRDSHRLIWTFGSDRQARAFTPDEWQDLARLAGERGMSSLCLRTLLRAQEAFATPIPAEVLIALSANGETGAVDQFLFHEGAWQRFRRGWSGERSWRSRRNLLRINLFPHPDVVREKYPAMQDWPLPLLYLRRLGSGTFKLVRQGLGLT